MLVEDRKIIFAFKFAIAKSPNLSLEQVKEMKPDVGSSATIGV
jgi:hypothetical protein